MKTKPDLIHFIRLNVAGIGYETYLCRRQIISRVPLGQPPMLAGRMASDTLIAIQHRLDSYFDAGNRPWTMSFSREKSSTMLGVGYGGRIDARDDKGRLGIRFTHTVLAHDSITAVNVCFEVLRSLAGRRFELFTNQISNVAVGAEAPNSVIASLTSSISGDPQELQGDIRAYPTYSRVHHDTAGAAPLAWVRLLAQQAVKDGEWNIYDIFDQDLGLYATVCEPTCGAAILASSLLLPTALPSNPDPQAPNDATKENWKPSDFTAVTSEAGSEIDLPIPQFRGIDLHTHVSERTATNSRHLYLESRIFSPTLLIAYMLGLFGVLALIFIFLVVS